MKVSELQPGQGSVNIEVTVKSIEEPKNFNKFGRDLKVANAIVTDESGEIKLTLWNDDIDKVKVGSVVKVTNGYVNEFNGEKQLTSGKFGKLEIVDGEGEENKEEVASEGSEEPKGESTEENVEEKKEESTETDENKEEGNDSNSGSNEEEETVDY